MKQYLAVFSVKSILFLATLVFLFVPDLFAMVITVEFLGTVNVVYDPCGLLDPSITVGETFTGSYTFNSEVVDLNPDPQYGNYVYSQPAPEGFSMNATIGNVLFESINAGSIAIDNLTTGDSYQVATSIEPFGDDHASMKLAAGGDASVYDSDALPLVPPDLNQIGNIGTFSIDYRFPTMPSNNTTVYGTLLELAVVPEPATFLIFGIGFAALRYCRQQRS